jgi:hypothetical protein
MIRQSKFKLNKNVISTTLGDEAVLLDHERGFYYSLNEVGVTVLNGLVQGSKTYERLLTKVLEEYEIDEVTASEDLDLLLEELVNEKLIRIIK